MQKLKNIILHCSDSAFGNVQLIDTWHKLRGWSGIGYHLVITNGYPTKENVNKLDYLHFLDGAVETGRINDFNDWIEDNEKGAHALGYNQNSIGICFILKKREVGLSRKQLKSGIEVVQTLLIKNRLKPSSVLGHYEINSSKTCPDFDVSKFRQMLSLEKEILDEGFF